MYKDIYLYATYKYIYWFYAYCVFMTNNEVLISTNCMNQY